MHACPISSVDLVWTCDEVYYQTLISGKEKKEGKYYVGGREIKPSYITEIRESIRYFQHTHSIPIMGVEKGGADQMVHGDLPRQHSFGTTLRFTAPVPGDCRQ